MELLAHAVLEPKKLEQPEKYILNSDSTEIRIHTGARIPALP